MYYQGVLSARDKQKSRLKRFARFYAQMLLNGSIDWNKLGLVYNTKEQLPEVKAKRLLRDKTVQEMVTDEILKIYENNGITPDFILKERLKILDMAKEKQDLSNANKVLESFESKLIDNKVTETKEVQQVSFVGMLDNGKQGKMIAKREVKQLKQDTKTDKSTDNITEQSASNEK